MWGWIDEKKDREPNWVEYFNYLAAVSKVW